MQKKPIKILLVEDDPIYARLIKEMLADALGEKDSFAIVHAMRLSDAIKFYAEDIFDVVLLDIMLPDSRGIETFQNINRRIKDAPIVVLSALDDEKLAVSAVRQGAQDYLVKMQIDGELLARSIRYAIERKLAGNSAKKLLSESTPIPEQSEYQYLKMIGSGQRMKEVEELVSTVAKTSNTSVLIQGETGTGKGLAANAIHFLSSRRTHPFIKLNCSSIPDTLLETELFGYEKGAFTDAKQGKKGLFEVAEGGTIFLDEIGDMDLKLQPKILHVLENRTLRRVGGILDIKTDVRIIAATNSNLEQLIAEKRFREDLYYRLKVMTIDIPPLRNRKEDIAPIAEYFIHENSKTYKKGVKRLSAKSKEIFLKYGWPGNVRELKNVIERAVILSDSEEILPEHLPLELTKEIPQIVPASSRMPSDNMSLEEIEKIHITNVLNNVKGNKTRASKILGISRLTLREKIKKYRIEDADKSPITAN